MKKLFLFIILGVVAVVGGKAVLKKKSSSAEIACSVETQEALAEDMVQPCEEPRVDRIHELFTLGINKLPIVETVTYTPRVSWLEGRAAWIADYASYFKTSRHFIARSLNGKPDYYTQKISHGDRFNVFNKNKNFEFYLLVDLEACNLHFYYTDLDTNEKTLLKSYKVGLGRPEATSPSGYLTPTGKYRLGEKVGIYKKGVTGTFQESEAEMIQIFGTRWIPFGEEIEGCTMGAKGYGLHGNPWLPNPETGELEECRDTIGQFDSDGCIRLNQEDIEELFSIVISKPTTIEIVKTLSGETHAQP
ncbi:MAG: L,D-transpeptidase [Chlamydiia bacterium]|nr:L,D-transpeptidase [Chlamydiia bacterium]MCP5508905.1 L,D-transpeptidase [Chlamydiales bacterium]HPE84873.1 L,D-transpeptidase [Chlamydiales bacterium]